MSRYPRYRTWALREGTYCGGGLTIKPRAAVARAVHPSGSARAVNIVAAPALRLGCARYAAGRLAMAHAEAAQALLGAPVRAHFATRRDERQRHRVSDIAWRSAACCSICLTRPAKAHRFSTIPTAACDGARRARKFEHGIPWASASSVAKPGFRVRICGAALRCDRRSVNVYQRDRPLPRTLRARPRSSSVRRPAHLNYEIATKRGCRPRRWSVGARSRLPALETRRAPPGDPH